MVSPCVWPKLWDFFAALRPFTRQKHKKNCLAFKSFENPPQKSGLSFIIFLASSSAIWWWNRPRKATTWSILRWSRDESDCCWKKNDRTRERIVFSSTIVFEVKNSWVFPGNRKWKMLEMCFLVFLGQKSLEKLTSQHLDNGTAKWNGNA